VIEHKRTTKETDIVVGLELYGSGKANIDTGVGFFDHMLEAFAKHAHIDLDVKCDGDLQIDAHHTVEDIGIVIGKVLAEAIYPVENIERYGNGTVVMDEASVSCDMDLSNRGFLVYDVPIGGRVGEFDVELVEEFFRALSSNMPMTLHLVYNRGKNKHHIIEATFKAFALSLRRAVSHNSRAGIPSTKGQL